MLLKVSSCVCLSQNGVCYIVTSTSVCAVIDVEGWRNRCKYGVSVTDMVAMATHSLSHSLRDVFELSEMNLCMQVSKINKN